MFKKILAPIDMQQPEQSGALLDVANRLAQQFDSAVHVITVMPGFGMPLVASYFPADAMETARKEIKIQLDDFVKDKLTVPATTSVAEGKRAHEILVTAEHLQTDLILIGCHAHGIVEDRLLGSCGTKIAQRAHCSVMIVRG